MNLESKYYRYVELLKTVQDNNGFIDTHECDSLLFTSLVGSLPEVRVNIDAAFDSLSGLWHRRPIDFPCYPEGSGSTISRDMLLGLCFYAYHKGRLDILEQIIQRALTNALVMGEGDKWRTIMSPGLLATYCWASYRLGGPKRSWLGWIPCGVSKYTAGYRAHLTVLHLLLRGKLTHSISKSHLKILKYHAERQPYNPLFLYAAGRTGEAEQILLREDLWPSDKLPTSLNRRSSWVIERDYGPSWLPVPQTQEQADLRNFSGGDFLFVAGLLLGKI